MFEKMSERNHKEQYISRRKFWMEAGMGIGGLALLDLLSQDNLLAADCAVGGNAIDSPLAPKPPAVYGTPGRFYIGSGTPARAQAYVGPSGPWHSSAAVGRRSRCTSRSAGDIITILAGRCCLLWYPSRERVFWLTVSLVDGSAKGLYLRKKAREACTAFLVSRVHTNNGTRGYAHVGA
jgi:hypothetical protein